MRSQTLTGPQKRLQICKSEYPFRAILVICHPIVVLVGGSAYSINLLKSRDRSDLVQSRAHLGGFEDLGTT